MVKLFENEYIYHNMDNLLKYLLESMYEVHFTLISWYGG